MKRVLTFGVFDFFHIGHLSLIEQAKSQGDFLIVAVQNSDSISKYKKNANIFYTTEQRVRMVKAIRIVDCVVTYDDVDKDIQNIDFDIFAIGEDQLHIGFYRAIQWCYANGKRVIRMSYTKNISSTILKNIY